jgi:hypothetical protein
VSDKAKLRRTYWVAELAKLSGSFGNDAARLTEELRDEIAAEGTEALLDHLRLCGAMPECYVHDSSEEKLYSKYTDAVVSEAFEAIGLKSIVIAERADAADVQARGRGYSLVADAKVFRLSRTAKNQKDFKVQALDGWRNALDYAVVVCPIYQLPSRASQIYQQAIARNVCILGYTHLAVLVGYASAAGTLEAEDAFHAVLARVSTLHPSKSANDYWQAVNHALVSALGGSSALWTQEKIASLDSVAVAKTESLEYLRGERDRLLGLSHQDALSELLRLSGLDSRIAKVSRIEHGDLLGI